MVLCQMFPTLISYQKRPHPRIQWKHPKESAACDELESCEGKCSNKILKYPGKNQENSYVQDIEGKKGYYWGKQKAPKCYFYAFSMSIVFVK